MSKYKIETKVTFIEMMISGDKSMPVVCKELGVSHEVAKQWWRLYRHSGIEGIIRRPASYSGEFKVHVVKYMHKNNIRPKTAAAIFGIPTHTTVKKWEDIYYKYGPEGLFMDRRGRPQTTNKQNVSKPKSEQPITEQREQDLMGEIHQLRAENAYLKKYNALVQEKKNLRTKRKLK